MNGQRNEARVTRRSVLGAGAGFGAGLMFRVTTVGLAQEATPQAEDEAQAIVGDVVEFTLTPEGRWAGPFSSVTLKLHPAWFDGGDAWFIRTDASDQAFAAAEGLVYVPLLRNALSAEGSYATLYRFPDAAEGQQPVLSIVPGRDDFTSAFQIVDVTFSGEPELLDSAAAIEEAADAGIAMLEPTDIIVNYPLVVWPGGGLAVDPDLATPGCPGWSRAQALAALVRAVGMDDLEVRVIDLSRADRTAPRLRQPRCRLAPGAAKRPDGR